MPPDIPVVTTITYVLDPHVETAFWLILWAIMIIIVGWIIDLVIAEFRRNTKDDRR